MQPKKQILILTPRYPFPVVGGDKLRIYFLCKELSKQYDLHLISLCDHKKQLSIDYDKTVFKSVERVYLPKWKSYFGSLGAFFLGKPLQIGYYYSTAFAKIVNSKMKNCDIALAHLIRTGHYLLKFKGPKILEMTDAISLNYERVRKQKAKKLTFKSSIYTIESLFLKNYDKKIATKFNLVTLVSQVDADFIRTKENDNLLLVASNGVEINRFMPVDVKKGEFIVFIGNMHTEQNIDACRYFAYDILPIVNKIKPNLKFKIIGIASESFLAEFNSIKNVIATGKVDSVSKAASDAFCSICSLRLGAGIQNKILEYMALQIPCISTSIGIEGINAKINEDIIVADTPHTIAEKIVELYENKDKAAKIGLAGYNYVKNNHSWESILSEFITKVKSL